MNSSFLERNRLPKQEQKEPPVQRPRAYCLLLLKGCQTRWYDSFDALAIDRFDHESLSFVWCDGEQRYVQMPAEGPADPISTPNQNE